MANLHEQNVEPPQVAIGSGFDGGENLQESEKKHTVQEEGKDG